MLHVWSSADIARQNGKIQAGDIIGTHAARGVGHAIERAQGLLIHARHPNAAQLAQIVHVGIVVNQHEFVDATLPAGVAVSSFDTLQAGAVVLRPTFDPGAQRIQRLCKLARSKVGSNYAVSTKRAQNFIKKALGISVSHPDAFSCSSLVKETFNMAYGVNSPFNSLKPVTGQPFIPLPADIAAAPGLVSVAP